MSDRTDSSKGSKKPSRLMSRATKKRRKQQNLSGTSSNSDNSRASVGREPRGNVTSLDKLLTQVCRISLLYFFGLYILFIFREQLSVPSPNLSDQSSKSGGEARSSIVSTTHLDFSQISSDTPLKTGTSENIVRRVIDSPCDRSGTTSGSDVSRLLNVSAGLATPAPAPGKYCRATDAVRERRDSQHSGGRPRTR